MSKCTIELGDMIILSPVGIRYRVISANDVFIEGIPVIPVIDGNTKVANAIIQVIKNKTIKQN